VPEIKELEHLLFNVNILTRPPNPPNHYWRIAGNMILESSTMPEIEVKAAAADVSVIRSQND